ncbi:hypothetical protein BJX68DRAFT_230006 [Aspergillus pseudodeflectus]|uniref:Secreted protein n=1 Tax=Aspergillus pseudodeflectus TaxID=176178 RepID=A0ABR4KWA6_9EURO
MTTPLSTCSRGLRRGSAFLQLLLVALTSSRLSINSHSPPFYASSAPYPCCGWCAFANRSPPLALQFPGFEPTEVLCTMSHRRLAQLPRCHIAQCASERTWA